MIRMLFAVAFAVCMLPAYAGDAVVLEIGEVEVQLAMPGDYIRASVSAPALYAVSSAAMPPPVRLVEALVAEDDLKRMLLGGEPERAYLQVQTIRDAEALSFSAEEWRALQPLLARQLGETDLDAGTRALQPGMNARMSDASGGAVALELGEIGKPLVYSQTDDIVRYAMRLPVGGSVNGKAIQATLACAGAALVINGKLLMLNAYLRVDHEQAGFAEVRAFLDGIIDETRRRNGGKVTQGG